MSIDLQHPAHVELRATIRENPGSVIPILGAGLSRPAGIPGWGGLRDVLAEAARRRIGELPEPERDGRKALLDRLGRTPSLWEAVSELKDILGSSEYERVITNTLRPRGTVKAPETYELLWKLHIRGCVSFNLDVLLQDAHAAIRQRAVDHATAKDVARYSQFLGGNQDFIFQPHGIVSDPDSWVLTTSEMRELLSRPAYVTFFRALCPTGHLLIIGFNPDDFSFEYLLQEALGPFLGRGPRHFAFLADPDPSVIRRLSGVGITTIPYHPDDPAAHSEIRTALMDIAAFVPQDKPASTVYLGEEISPQTLPPDDELIRLPVDRVRQMLNGAIASIIPPGRQPEDADLKEVQQFYQRHLKAIHMAWLVQPDSDFATIHGNKVITPVGRGAFGQVYEAENTASGERVAVKVLLPEIRSDPDYLNSFRRGVKSMRILTEQHVPGMVVIRDAFEVPACIVMDYVDGLTIEQAEQRGVLKTISDRLHIIARVAQIVDQAHKLDQRVLHRDLKPANIMLRGLGEPGQAEVVVLDFDLSWHKGASEMSVVHGARAQGYAAPEQTATGRNRGESTRHTGVDVFGLGMVAYFLLAGEDPRPNQHMFTDFEPALLARIERRFTIAWKCLPVVLASIVRDCTRDKQADRMKFTAAREAFETCYRLAATESMECNHPNLLLELAARLRLGVYEVKDFGRFVVVRSGDGGKMAELTLETGERGGVVAKVVMRRIQTASDHRNIKKYYPKAMDKAVAALKQGGFQGANGQIRQGMIEVSSRLPFGTAANANEIEAAAEIIREGFEKVGLNQ